MAFTKFYFDFSLNIGRVHTRNFNPHHIDPHQFDPHQICVHTRQKVDPHQLNPHHVDPHQLCVHTKQFNIRIQPERTCLSIRECVYKKFLLRLKSKSMMNVHFEMHAVRRNGTNCRDVIFLQVITSHSHCRLKTAIINWASFIHPFSVHKVIVG